MVLASEDRFVTIPKPFVPDRSCMDCSFFRRDPPPWDKSGGCVKRGVGVYATDAHDCEYYWRESLWISAIKNFLRRLT